MGKIIITINFVNTEITIIHTILFEFENMYLFSMSPKKNFVTDLWNFALKITQNGQKENVPI